MTDPEAEIAALEAARRDALVAVDKDVLADLFSDALIWTHANGTQDSKASYIAGHGTKAKFLAIEPVEEVIAVWSDAAAVTAELTMTLQPRDKEPMVLRTRASSVWAREAGSWRLVRFHSGMIG